jgi:hypothetical protein
VTLSFQFLSNETKKKRQVINKKTHRYSITFPTGIESRGSSGQVLHVGFVSLLDLHKMYGEMGRRATSANVHSGENSL